MVDLSVMLVVAFLATLVSGATRTVDNSCPPGVLQSKEHLYLQVYGDSCFHFVLHKKRVYDHAKKDCLRNGGTLALVKTQDINDFLTGTLLNMYKMSDPVWIGLHDRRYENTFMWEDGSAAGWTNFAGGYGLGLRLTLAAFFEDCVALDPADGGMWHNSLCEINLLSILTKSKPAKSYICQYRLRMKDGQKTYGAGNAKPYVQKGNTKPYVQNGKTKPYVQKDNTKPYVQKGNTKPYVQIAGSTKRPGQKDGGDQYKTSNGQSVNHMGDTDTMDGAPAGDNRGSQSTDGCPTLNCNLDCGIFGLKTDQNNCPICECRTHA